MNASPHAHRLDESVSFAMSEVESPQVLPGQDLDSESQSKDTLEPGFLVLCWNDPVNLMAYVTHVFQKVFGWSREKAERHMLQVHQEGKSVLVRESLEKAEHYVHCLQQYRLHATLERE